MKPSDDTRARVKALTEQLETGVKAVFESEKYKDYLKAMSKLHHYSFGNVMLILMQCPEASMVAGYATWKKQFGRTVKKGEHGIMILAPVMGSRLINQDRLNPDTHQPIIGPDGEPEKEPVFVPYRSFRVAYVFDVSQTEGRELPSLGVGELSGEVEHFARIFAAVEALSPVPVEYRPAQKSKGCYSHWEQKIYLNRGMSQVQTLKTLIHETAHALLHARPEAADKDRHTRGGGGREHRLCGLPALRHRHRRLLLSLCDLLEQRQGAGRAESIAGLHQQNRLRPDHRHGIRLPGAGSR